MSAVPELPIYYGLNAFRAPREGVVLTIGNFDGVHLGHAAILAAAGQLARQQGCTLLAVTFDPHPLAVLAPQRAPARLTSMAYRAALLANHGVDAVIVLKSDMDLLSMTAEHFIHALVQSTRPRSIVEGPDFNFGRDRGGSLNTLREYAPREGFTVHACAAARCTALEDQPIVSSSAIRAALRDAQVERAAAMLGRPHRISGRVGTGDARGADLGFATANLEDVPQVAPADGVYAAIAQLASGQVLPAAVNIGAAPTFDRPQRRIEAHLLDFRGGLRGERLALHLLARFRGQARFASIDALRAQLAQDVVQTRAVANAALALGVLRLPID